MTLDHYYLACSAAEERGVVVEVVASPRVPSTTAYYSLVLLIHVVDLLHDSSSNVSIVSTRARIKHGDVDVLAPRVQREKI